MKIKTGMDLSDCLPASGPATAGFHKRNASSQRSDQGQCLTKRCPQHSCSFSSWSAAGTHTNEYEMLCNPLTRVHFIEERHKLFQFAILMAVPVI